MIVFLRSAFSRLRRSSIRPLLQSLSNSANLPAAAFTAKSLAALALVFFFLAIYAFLGTVPREHPALTKSIFISLVVIAVAAVTAYRAMPNEDWRERFYESLNEILLAVGIACAIIYVSQDREEDRATISQFFSDEGREVFGLAFLVFSLDQLAKSTRLLRDFGEEGKKISGIFEVVESARTTAIHARYAGLAAEALRLPDRWLRGLNETSDGVDELLPEPLLASLTAARAWIQARELYANHDELHRAAWSESMRIYYQEEVFDIARSEIATNVRNYAFLIIGIVSRMKESEQVEGGKKLVLLHSTPFAPKDFYNYPNGTKDNRFYHEAEFFGTYRRVLARIAADPQVIPLRIFLSSSLEKVKADQGLGWTLDSTEKIILDLARYRIIPVPITFERIKEDGAQKAFLTSEPKDGIRKLPYLHHAPNDPADRLPHQVKRILWAPTYVDLRNSSQSEFMRAVDSSSDPVEDIRQEWRKRHPLFLKQTTEEYSQWFTSLQRATASAWPDLYADAQHCHQVAWNRLIHEFIAASTLLSLKQQVTAWITGDEPVESLARLIDSSYSNLGIRRQDILTFLPILRRLRKAVNEYESFRTGTQSQEDEIKATNKLLFIVKLVQEADSHLQLLRDERYKPETTIASTGIELGPAEDWFHRFMILQEASEIDSIVRQAGPLPLLDLLASDLCGVDIASTSGDAFLNQLLSVSRIFELSSTKSEGADLQALLLRGEISPEFILVGFWKPGEGNDSDGFDISAVEWVTLIRAEISEPFHTCRVSLRFNGPAHADEVATYKDWAIDVWRKSAIKTEAALRAALKEKRASDTRIKSTKERRR